MDETDKKIDGGACRARRQDPQQDDGGARNCKGRYRRRGPAHGPAVGGAVRRAASSGTLGPVRADWPTGLPARTCSPPESFGTLDTRETERGACSCAGFSSKRSDVCLGSRRRRGKAVAGRRRRHDIGGRFTIVVTSPVSSDCQHSRRDRTVVYVCRRRNQRKVRRPDVREIPQGCAASGARSSS